MWAEERPKRSWHDRISQECVSPLAPETAPGDPPPRSHVVRQYQHSYFNEGRLLSRLKTLITRGNVNTAEVLACIAEVDARKLYLPAGYPSMYHYCLQELHLCEQAAFKRILAARTARRFPAIFEAVAGGRLHLSAIVLLASHLTQENADELIAAATHRTKAEIEYLIAERFPRPDVLSWVQEMPPSAAPSTEPPSPAHGAVQLSPGKVDASSVSARVDPPVRAKPLSGQSFEVQFTFGKSAHEKLQYAQELLSHQVPQGDVAAVVERALDALIPQLEKRKFAATGKPRPPRHRSSANPRHIPARVKRAVWERDHGQCTFVSDTGHRCLARSRLEFDHVQEVSCGGETTVAGIRLRCRAHNQYTAERAFGAGFMCEKRLEARRSRERVHVMEELAPRQVETAEVRSHAAAQDQSSDLEACLRTLGFRASEVRQAERYCENNPDGSLEGRVRAALAFFRPPRQRMQTETTPGLACSAS
jgi:hypothetical protein